MMFSCHQDDYVGANSNELKQITFEEIINNYDSDDYEDDWEGEADRKDLSVRWLLDSELSWLHQLSIDHIEIDETTEPVSIKQS